ncbi:MAG: hypothetical protein HFI33_00650 [Lachnospiraceae bacterium]|nr:hypothetical protein [Lachnospiraceae bacterium]
MNRDLPCAVVRDVAPLYVEDLVAGETRALVEEHLAGCEGCREQYAIYQEEMEEETHVNREQNAVEVDYMKKIRAYQRENMILGAIVSFFLGLFIPVALVGFSVIANGGMEAYQWARLQVAWHIGILRMVESGAIVCALYLGANYLLKRRRIKKAK